MLCPRPILLNPTPLPFLSLLPSVPLHCIPSSPFLISLPLPLFLFPLSNISPFTACTSKLPSSNLPFFPFLFTYLLSTYSQFPFSSYHSSRQTFSLSPSSSPIYSLPTTPLYLHLPTIYLPLSSPSSRRLSLTSTLSVPHYLSTKHTWAFFLTPSRPTCCLLYLYLFIN